MLLAIKLVPEHESPQILATYIRASYTEFLLIIVLIAQPLRPLCFLEEFESIEWLIGQGCYAAGECYFLTYFLQILAILKGDNERTSRTRNVLLAAFVVVPISFDRLMIAFSSHTRVIVNISDQIESIDTIMQVCWFCFIVFTGFIGYDFLLIVQNPKAYSKHNVLTNRAGFVPG